MISRFQYRAYAIGVSGQITRPINHLIQSQAVSGLSPAGGYSSAKQEAYRLLEILSHGGSTSEVTGNHNAKTGNYETSVTATMQGLNIGNVLLLESCTAYLSLIHPADGGQPRIAPRGSFFRNLRIAGQEIELESRVEDYSTTLDTFDGLRKRYKDDAEFRERFLKEAHVGKENELHEKQHKYFPWRNITDTAELPVSKGTEKTAVPLFIVKNKSAPGFHVSGNVITVENFGSVIIGELVISGYERRLTMLQANLGSPTDGNLSCAVVEGNGGGGDP
jgi:hypothetical protein